MISKAITAVLSLLLLWGAVPLAADRRNADTVTTAPTATAPVRNETRITTEADVPHTQSTRRAETMTASEAEDAALAVVGLAREEVLFSRTEFDVEHGVFVWEVEFQHEAWEYDFTLDAVDGTVLAQTKEYDPAPADTAAPAPDSPAVTQPPATSNTHVQEKPAAQTTSSVLTAEEATDIALTHASLSKADVTHLKTEQDRDDGVLIWEIEFRQGRAEYEYEIHAQTGKVLDWERDIDD